MAKAKMNEESKTLYLARALYDAVEDSNIQQVNTLLSQNKANPNILLSEEGLTAFHLAAGHENLAFGKVASSLFLHNGGDPNVLCVGNRTVLHIAVAWNRSSVVEILLNSPFIIPNPFIKDDDGLNAFNYAVKFKAWESLATLQSYMKHSKNTNNSNNKVCKILEPNDTRTEKKDNSLTKEKNDKISIVNESTFNKSDKLHTSSGYFNSGESLNNSSKSIKFDSVSQKHSIHCDSVSFSTDNSCDDILNKNISPDYTCSELTDDNATANCLNESILLRCEYNDFESLENISFPSNDLFPDFDPDLYDYNEIELVTNDISSQSSDLSPSDNEWMTDISGLSNCLSSDDFYTCPDTNSEYCITNSRIDKSNIKLEDIIIHTSMISIDDSVRSISKISTGTDNLNMANHNISSSDESNTDSLTEITEDYDTDYVRYSLRKYGFPPGPVVPSTKRVYIRKLKRIIKNQSDHGNSDKPMIIGGPYSSQLTKTVTSDRWKENIKSWSSLEDEIVCNESGSSFTYLLLDPRVSKNLPARVDQIDNPIEIWQTFINSIFYIGKGTKSRPNDHMSEAFVIWTEKNNKEKTRKVEYIISLWKENLGVVCVQAFHHLSSKEAQIREAAMIDAIGLDVLTNEKRGTYFDKTIRWRNSDRCKLGCRLLYRAMLVFLADGERQMKPVDLT